jgi:integration host factor subunit alpha
MSLTKRDIARAIHETEPEISIFEAVNVVDLIFTTLKDRLAAGDKVMITNFGTFQVVERAPRKGINPATGGGLVIDAHRAVSFRPSPSLQELLNRDEDAPAGDLDPAEDR